MIRVVGQWIKKLLHGGANADVEAELIKPDQYRAAQNMRPYSVFGSGGSLVQIGGEVLKYNTSNPNASHYFCKGACQVGQRVVSFWASDLPDTQFPIILIGDVGGSTAIEVANAQGIPYTFDHDMQMPMTVDDGCNNGVIYPVDGNTPPLFWDVQSLIDNYNQNTDFYFGSFNLNTQLVGLNAPANFPVYKSLVKIGGNNGLPAGQYQYALQWETLTGDLTNIGLFSSFIPIPQVYQNPEFPVSPYPGGQTIGGLPDVLTPTPYGLEIWFRVDNRFGYRGVRLIRRRINSGLGLSDPGVLEVIARFTIQVGDYSIIKFIDPSDENVLEVLPPLDPVALPSLEQIDKPLTSELTDRRLIYADYLLQSRIVNPEYVGGAGGVAITKALTGTVSGNTVPDGYENPLQFARYKRYQNGEMYGFGIEFWDGALGKAPAITAIQSFQFPERRDLKDADSALFSDDLLWNAIARGTSNGDMSADPVNPTFEVVSQGTRRKTDETTPVNIYSTGTYSPWHPTHNDDQATLGLNYNSRPTIGNGVDGQLFAPTYQALGLLMNPPTIASIPSWVSAFTVGRTQRAGRVVCQGIGVYALQPASGTLPAQKGLTSVDFHSPDLENGFVPGAIQDDIQQNPDKYQLIAVAPVGFMSEVYSSYPISRIVPPFLSPEWYGFATDLISYARIFHDEGQVNAGELTTGMAAQPGVGSLAPPGNYITWNKNRDTTADPYDPLAFWQQAGNNGNSPLGIASFTPVQSGRGTYYFLTSPNYIYNYPSALDNFPQFNDPWTRRFHEPFYIFNIIDPGASIPDLNQTNWISTGCNVMMSSCIGISNGLAFQVFDLLDERPEDCFPYLDTDYRYVWLAGNNYPERAYCCVTGNAFLSDPINLTQAFTDIGLNGFWLAPDGTHVRGFYSRSTGVDGADQVNFSMGFVPPEGVRISVKYSEAPLRVFGGDSTVGPSIFAPIDRQVQTSITPTITSAGDFPLQSLPMPFAGFSPSPSCFTVSPNFNQSFGINSIRGLRQWVIAYDCETQTPQNYNVNINGIAGAPNDQAQFFPAKGFIPHPYLLNPPTLAGPYLTDYPNEDTLFLYGGFRFLPSTNFDYAKEEDPTFAGLPKAGFTEITDGCDRLAASNVFAPSQQDSPGLRTFTVDNVHLLSQENGRITAIGASTDENGQNMRYWTEKGMGTILISKHILTDAAGNLIGTQNIDQFWGDEIWASRTTGLPLSLRRSWTRRENSFWWADKFGMQEFTGGLKPSISSGKFNSVALPILNSILTDNVSRMCTTVDPINKEIWWTLPDQSDTQRTVTRVLVYSYALGEYVGEFTYNNDKYLSVGQAMLGFRNLVTRTMNSGFTLNGSTMTAWGEQVYTPSVGERFWATAFRFSPDNPTRIEIRDPDYNLVMYTDQATNGPRYTIQSDGYWQAVGRKNIEFDAAQDLVQYEVFYLRGINSDPKKFRITIAELACQKLI